MLYPVALSPAPGEDAFEIRERVFFLSGFRRQAGGVEQRAHVVGVEVERPSRPVEGRLPPSQVVLVGGGAGLRPLQGLTFTVAEHVAPKQCGDAFGDFVLNRKDVVERAIEPL